jgi:hypothetical protein
MEIGMQDGGVESVSFDVVGAKDVKFVLSKPAQTDKSIVSPPVDSYNRLYTIKLVKGDILRLTGVKTSVGE